MKKFVFLLCISLISLQSVGQVKQIVKKKYYGGKFNEQDTTAGYTEAVLVDNTLYISGWIGRGTIAEQLQEIYSNLGSILGAFGATYQNVVKETLFTTDIEGVKNSNSVRKAFYKGDFPAATWVQITRLYSARADAQIEVELIAHLQNSKK
ncbi:MAG TPA: Rid family hydrolase [Chryseolinea sp.]|jgi:enamine deaminase RidA (YjgF/YER057c/UK114 family)|nr:Rid family hydrolase [Chryseolinea sp.]